MKRNKAKLNNDAAAARAGGLSFVFAALLVSGCLACPPQVALGSTTPPAGNWPSSHDESWYDSSRTSFTLRDAKDLAGLAYLVDTGRDSFEGKTVNLSSDIDLSSVCGGDVDWLPIGLEGSLFSGNPYPFKGTFDGKNHTISGLHISNTKYGMALFGNAKDAELRNFTVRGSVKASDCAGVVYEANNTNLKNIVNYANVDASAASDASGRAAGVALRVVTSYSSRDIDLSNLSNYGSVKASGSFAGGVIGFLSNASGMNTAVSQCMNAGSVTVNASTNTKNNSNSSYGAGGIIGSSNYAGIGIYQVSECYNTGKVTASAGISSVGGIAGYFGGNGSSIDSCYNTGDISGNKATAGIAGYVGVKDGSVTATYSSGQISSDSASKAAGVVGSSSNNGLTLDHNYTMEGSVSKTYGSSVDASNADGSKTREELLSESFLDFLNIDASNFKLDLKDGSLNGGLPVLAWQGGRDPSNAGSGEDGDGDQGQGSGDGDEGTGDAGGESSGGSGDPDGASNGDSGKVDSGKQNGTGTGVSANKSDGVPESLHENVAITSKKSSKSQDKSKKDSDKPKKSDSSDKAAVVAAHTDDSSDVPEQNGDADKNAGGADSAAKSVNELSGYQMKALDQVLDAPAVVDENSWLESFLIVVGSCLLLMAGFAYETYSFNARRPRGTPMAK